MRREPSRFVKFCSSVVEPVSVALSDDKQRAARTLIAAKKVCAYERTDGLIGEIGIPRKPEHAGRIFKPPRERRRPAGGRAEV